MSGGTVLFQELRSPNYWARFLHDFIDIHKAHDYTVMFVHGHFRPTLTRKEVLKSDYSFNYIYFDCGALFDARIQQIKFLLTGFCLVI